MLLTFAVDDFHSFRARLVGASRGQLVGIQQRIDIQHSELSCQCRHFRRRQSMSAVRVRVIVIADILIVEIVVGLVLIVLRRRLTLPSALIDQLGQMMHANH
jgi:hypothetical protein